MTDTLAPRMTALTPAAVDSPPPFPQCLAAQVLRPPSLRWVGGQPLVARLLDANRDAAAGMPGVRAVVVRNNFAAVVADSEEQAVRATAALQARWATPPSPEASPVRRQTLAQRGNASTALEQSRARQAQHYQWPLAGMQAATATCTVIADWRGGTLRVWLPSARPGALRAELAALLGITEQQITLVCWQDADDTADPGLLAHHAAADAALLAHATGGCVRRTITADGVGLADAMLHWQIDSARGGADIDAYAATLGGTFAPSVPLALWLTHTAAPVADVAADTEAADNVLPPYRIPNIDIGAAGANAAGASLADARAQVFAQESHLDEIAASASTDPVALRLGHLEDARGATLVREVAERAGWMPSAPGTGAARGGNVRRGRGFAYAHTVENDTAQSWSAWVAEVEVDGTTGELAVTRVTVGHDSEAAVPARSTPASPALEDMVAQTARQLTAQSPGFDAWPAELPEASDITLPAVTGVNVPEIRVAGTLAARGTLAAGPAATLPAAAAVANAIYDATGVRLREPPFSADRIRLALDAQQPEKRRSKRGWFAAAAAAAAGLCATVLPWRAPVAPVAPTEPGFYSAATLERGRLVAAAGDCAVCHTAPGGVKNAGGLALETPFGTVYSTNITPDVETGIGNWSFAAFERAMREGIHRDGRRLYPAFPYTAFAKISDADMQSLYAYLMSAEPVKADVPRTELAFPFNMRPLLAGWNLLFHRNEQFQPDATRSAQWNRGAYLAEGLGHCSACHSPRNALGGEKGGRHYLTGGTAEGWDAPALTALSRAPVPWTEDALFTYLRGGYAVHHGAAAGPMAPVVEELALLPESDVRAIAHYVASFNAPPPAPAQITAQAAQYERRSAEAATTLGGPAARLYQSACAVCHQSDQGMRQFGVKPSLALNTNLHSDRPDNVIQVLLQGMPAPPNSTLGAMPSYADSLDDQQIVALTQYLRARFAPDKPAWQDVEATVARLRTAPAH
ncbi:Nicotinate dehydrogenase subunit B [Cupriavidus numazuensis]|uniref:Nicotinate dehydrogenase subunit B n=2 Tax=Cupriavidus numazuensis TaxID=221992 RepID=A0ABN7Q019_9BURK|nr:Nicotinate dehydrogenase subunit B [Cupriavidus numazuensis]